MGSNRMIIVRRGVEVCVFLVVTEDHGDKETPIFALRPPGFREELQRDCRALGIPWAPPSPGLPHSGPSKALPRPHHLGERAKEGPMEGPV